MMKKLSTFLIWGIVVVTCLYFMIDCEQPNLAFPEDGGKFFGFEFRAVLIEDPLHGSDGNELGQYDATLRWIFTNRADHPVEFSIPVQKFHRIEVSRKSVGRMFEDLPDDLQIIEPITLAPNEEKELVHQFGYISKHGLQNADIRYEVIAKIDSTFHILMGFATVERAKTVE